MNVAILLNFDTKVNLSKKLAKSRVKTVLFFLSLSNEKDCFFICNFLIPKQEAVHHPNSAASSLLFNVFSRAVNAGIKLSRISKSISSISSSL